MKLDEKASRRAMKPLMEKLGVDEKSAAEAIFRTVNANMANKITEVSTKRGYDIRNTIMIAGGGGGPIHGGFIADSTGRSPGRHTSGRRALTAPSACSPWTLVRTTRAPLSAVPQMPISKRSTASTQSWKLRRTRLSERTASLPHEVVLKRSADLRYVGQFHEVEVDIAGRQNHARSGGCRRGRRSRASTRSSTPSPCRGRRWRY